MDSTFAHEFFHMPCAQWVGDIPADARQNNILWKMGPLKAHGHRLSPSLFTPSHRGRSYLKWPQMKIATDPGRARAPPRARGWPRRHGGEAGHQRRQSTREGLAAAGGDPT